MFAYHSIFLCRARSNFGYSLLRNICCGYVLYCIACLKCCLIFSLYVLFFSVMKCIISKVYEIRYSCMCQYRSNMKSFVSSKFFLIQYVNIPCFLSDLIKQDIWFLAKNLVNNKIIQMKLYNDLENIFKKLL